MTDRRTLDALSRGYALIGGILDRGIQPEDLTSLREDPALWAALPKTASSEVDLDAINADHHSVLGLNVYARRGVFVDPTLAVTDDDHIAVTLGRLAARSAANEDPVAELASLCRWIAPFAIALRRDGGPFFLALADLLSATIDHHVRAADVDLRSIVLGDRWALDEEDGVRQLVEILVTPARCGGLLTKMDLRSLGSELRIPAGFGSRPQTLENLFASAAEFDESAALLTAIAGRFEVLVDLYDAWSDEHPALAPAAAPWRRSAAFSARRVASMADLVDSSRGRRRSRRDGSDHGADRRESR